MNEQKLTNEQRANSEKLLIYFKQNKEIHITLNKRTLTGQHYYYNGTIVQSYSDTLFELKDRLNGENIIFSVFQLKDDGVSEYTPHEKK